MLAARTIPGVRIDVSPPPLAEVLPRMDVAVFVGFASTGPTHRPVAIESVAQFAAIFGHDAALAWDGERGERVYTNLGPSVRAFFSNGGTRCWVIRVARTAALEAGWRGIEPDAVAAAGIATANRFVVPGVLLVTSAGSSVSAAQVQARSIGSWSDPLRVSAALTVTSFSIEECASIGGSLQRLTFATAATLRVGDLLELGDPSAAGGDAERLFATVDRTVTGASAAAVPHHIEATLCAAFASLSSPANGGPAPSGNGNLEIAGVTAGAIAATLEVAPTPTVECRLRFEVAASGRVASGQWARWSDGTAVIWVCVDGVGSHLSTADPNRLVVSADGRAWRELSPLLPSVMPTRASALTLDLRVSSDQEVSFHMSGVGLTPAHRASWWRQVCDDLRYAVAADAATSAGPRSGDATDTAFPLAALDTEVTLAQPLAWIPLGVTSGYGAALPPLPQAASALERDGLARFDAELFLDPGLADLDGAVLIEHADTVRVLSDEPRELFGIHAALSIGTAGLYNEASLIAVPDAQQVGWSARLADEPLAATPARQPPPPHWFSHRGACAAAPADSTAIAPDFGTFLDYGTHLLPAPVLQGPVGPVRRGAYRLTWSASEPGCEYVLREAQRADLRDARDIYRGAALTYDVSATRDGVFRYVVQAVAGDERSDESNALAVVVRDDEWLANPADVFAIAGEEQLLRVHRAVLKLAAATGELFAALGVPRHYRAPDALHYAARLRAGRSGDGTLDPHGFEVRQRRALSYGALYHPWAACPVAAAPSATTQLPAGSGARAVEPVEHRNALRVCPPDGIVTGVLAGRALRRGAWIAAANEPFKDVFALTPPIGAEAWPQLQDAAINLLLSDPRGFMTLSATTLADELELQPINVRRLLILLRRLALRRGVSYVFEPNGDALRRSVERGFRLLLTDLFRRGAFAGATADESFKVAVSGANSIADQENGRLIIELRVAPALPLQFLTVHLAQTGERFSVSEEI